MEDEKEMKEEKMTSRRSINQAELIPTGLNRLASQSQEKTRRESSPLLCRELRQDEQLNI